MFTKNSYLKMVFEKNNANYLIKTKKTIDFYYKYKYNNYEQFFLEE